MKAAVSREVGRIAVEDLAIAGPGPGEIGIRVEATGVCHTDLSALEGKLPIPRPIVLGHEGAGVVTALGPGVEGLALGDKVVCSIIAPCRACFQCTRGDPAMCERIAFYTGRMQDGTTRLRRGEEEVYSLSYQGSFAEEAVVPAACAVRVPREAPLEKLCGLACGVSTGLGAAMVRAEVEAGSTVVVIGAGGVGLSTLMGARLREAERLIAVDVVPAKLARAQALGLATDVIDATREDVALVVRELSGGRGADYAFDAAGVPGTAEQAIEVLRPGGKAVVIGRVGDVRLDIPTTQVLRHKWVTGTFGGSIDPHRHIPEFVDLYLRGRLDLDGLMDTSYALDDLERAFADLREGRVTRGVICFASPTS
ncbi:MAG: alcohol dehydrogenase catalytic domain-containing protein [Spirochaetaceae bacterium]|nr:alcohol dehydrogenase catalytic domain-containing protein [Myxococcales bacterium]MCB9723173.1 alcohol dehydrogenase catalytic domain-containing protein [Spirochaetaceae bacterium]HPG27664.1 alcohol dehydrogenase catalytic domain-containing protein [Myxococcota bacterium]